MSARCEAAYPTRASLRGDGTAPIGWAECTNPAALVYEYVCLHLHKSEKKVCTVHLPQEGLVGCRQCYDDGHECPMTFQRVPGLYTTAPETLI